MKSKYERLREIAEGLSLPTHEEQLEFNPMATEDFFYGYGVWTQLRFNRIIKHYGIEFFKGKTLLEVGCGTGDFGNRFYEIGAVVTCVDGRSEHIEILNNKHPHLKSYVANLNESLGISDFFDIILHAGTLYHLNDYKSRIKESCAQCNYLILETVVTNSRKDEDSRSEKTELLDASINGKASWPSIIGVETVLTANNFLYTRLLDELNVGFRKYDGDGVGGNNWYGEYRSLWCCQRQEMRL